MDKLDLEIIMRSGDKKRMVVLARTLGAYYLGIPISDSVMHQSLQLANFAHAGQDSNLIDSTTFARSLPSDCSPKLVLWLLIVSGQITEAIWFARQFRDTRSNLLLTVTLKPEELCDNLEDYLSTFTSHFLKNQESNDQALLHFCLQTDVIFGTTFLKQLEAKIFEKIELVLSECPLIVCTSCDLPREPVYVNKSMSQISESADQTFKLEASRYNHLQKLISNCFHLWKISNQINEQCETIILELIKTCRQLWKDDFDYMKKANVLVECYDLIRQKTANISSKSSDDRLFQLILFIIIRDQFSFAYRMVAMDKGNERKLLHLAYLWFPFLSPNEKVELVGMLFILGMEVEQNQLEFDATCTENNDQHNRWTDKFMARYRCSVDDIQTIATVITYVFEKYLNETASLPCFCDDHRPLWKDNIMNNVQKELIRPSTNKDCHYLSKVMHLSSRQTQKFHDSLEERNLIPMLNYLTHHIEIPNLHNQTSSKISMNLNITPNEMITVKRWIKIREDDTRNTAEDSDIDANDFNTVPEFSRPRLISMSSIISSEEETTTNLESTWSVRQQLAQTNLNNDNYKVPKLQSPAGKTDDDYVSNHDLDNDDNDSSDTVSLIDSIPFDDGREKYGDEPKNKLGAPIPKLQLSTSSSTEKSRDQPIIMPLLKLEYNNRNKIKEPTISTQLIQIPGNYTKSKFMNYDPETEKVGNYGKETENMRECKQTTDKYKDKIKRQDKDNMVKKSHSTQTRRSYLANFAKGTTNHRGSTNPTNYATKSVQKIDASIETSQPELKSTVVETQELELLEQANQTDIQTLDDTQFLFACPLSNTKLNSLLT